MKFFRFDVEHRYRASLVTPWEPWISLTVQFDRQAIGRQVWFEPGQRPLLELTGARIELAYIGALKIVVPDHPVAVDGQVVG